MDTTNDRTHIVVLCSSVVLPVTYGAIRSSGLETKNFKLMTKLNTMQIPEYTTKPAISYSTCYVSVIFLNFFLGGFFYV